MVVRVLVLSTFTGDPGSGVLVISEPCEPLQPMSRSVSLTGQLRALAKLHRIHIAFFDSIADHPHHPSEAF
jgi:hypothetical protein